MKQKYSQGWMWRGSSAVVLASLAFPLTGCGSKSAPTSAPGPGGGAMVPAGGSKPGLSTKQKLVLLGGAAALVYYYNRSKKANQAKYAGQQITYYRSKNGGIYYRDPQNPRKAIFVTKPTQTTFQVPPEEAAAYSGYEGYNNATTGRTFDDAFPAG